MSGKVRCKRIYEPAQADDGLRVLVDALWPRGVTKAKAGVDLWLKAVAPTPALRKWFGHRPERWAEFRRRYLAELQDNPALAELQALAAGQDITLLYAARDEAHNQAAVLVEQLTA